MQVGSLESGKMPWGGHSPFSFLPGRPMDREEPGGLQFMDHIESDMTKRLSRHPPIDTASLDHSAPVTPLIS